MSTFSKLDVAIALLLRLVFLSKIAVGVAVAIASSTASPIADFDENKQ